MCLSSLDENFSPEPEAEGIGWKIFDKEDNGSLLFPIKRHEGSWSARANRWLTSPSGQINGWNYTDRPFRYPKGFHLYPTRKVAAEIRFCEGLNFTVRRIKWRGLLASGEQDGFPVIVVRQIRILPKKRR